MEVAFLILGRIIIGIASITILGFIIKARLTNRLGNEFFVIMLIFWVGLLFVVIEPSILDSVLNRTGFENRTQFLLSVSIIIIVYLLVNQTRKGRSVLKNYSTTIRTIALDLFGKEYKNESKTDLVILIAAKNEEHSIGNVIKDIKRIKIPCDFKILVVNDGSTDKTEKIARDNDALVITHYQNLGVGGAIKTGYLACGLLQPKMVITIDADGQHDPSYIPEIIKEIENGADMVYGTRFAKESKYKTSSVRLVGNKFYSKLVSRLGKIKITDVTSGYRAIRYSRLPDVYFIAETNFAIELALRASKNQLKITEISTAAKPRVHGQSQLYRIEKFFTYNFNVIIQIINGLFRSQKLSDL